MYVSINFHCIDDYFVCNDNSKYILEAILMRKENKRLPLYGVYTKNHRWINYDTVPNLIYTEKTSALIKIYLNYKPGKRLVPILNKINTYEITKFLLLKIIVNDYLVIDILKVIVDLSD